MDGGLDLPVFMQTAPSCVNYCGSCRVAETSGCWRRGWNLTGSLYINLCNRCGLRYKNGKLQPFYSASERDISMAMLASSSRQLGIRVPKAGSSRPLKRTKPSGPPIRPPHTRPPQRPLPSVLLGTPSAQHAQHNGNHSPHYTVPVHTDSSLQLEQLPAPRGGRYMMKRTAAPEGQTVQFFVEGDDGGWRLAAVGIDTRGSGHFTYLAEHEFGGASALRCTNRSKVLDWLASMGYTEGLDPASLGFAGEQQLAAWPQDAWQDAAASGELASCGPPVASPSPEVVSAFASQPELLEWVAGVPDDEGLARFQSWAAQLLAVVGEEPPPDCRDTPHLSWVLPADALPILAELEAAPVSLRLLEASGISRPVAALRSHVDLELAAAASRVAAKWRGIAAAALTTASQALMRAA